MRVLLQNTETKLYYREPEQWTDDPAQAMDFEYISQAVRIYSRESVFYAQIVLESGGSPQDCRLPVATFETHRVAQGK